MADPKPNTETVILKVEVEGLERLAVPILVVETPEPLTIEQAVHIHDAAARALDGGVLVLPAGASVYWVTP